MSNILDDSKGLLGFLNHYLLKQTRKNVTVVRSEFQNTNYDYELMKVNMGTSLSPAAVEDMQLLYTQQTEFGAFTFSCEFYISST
jgi:hypothetical protein